MALVDFFLKIEGIPGEATDSKHKDEIDVLSWSWGATQTGSHSYGSGGGAGKVSMQDFHFVKKVDKSSHALMLHCANGSHIKSALLTCRKAGGSQQEYLKITLSDLLVSSFQTSGSQGSEVVPTEQFSLNFSQITYQYAPQKADGTLAGYVKSGWNLKENKAASA